MKANNKTYYTIDNSYIGYLHGISGVTETFYTFIDANIFLMEYLKDDLKSEFSICKEYPKSKFTINAHYPDIVDEYGDCKIEQLLKIPTSKILKHEK